MEQQDKVRARKKRSMPLIIILIVLAGVGLGVLQHKLGPYHFKTVKENILYRSGSMRSGNLADMVKRHQIKTIVSLRLPDEGGWQPDWYKMEEAFCKDNGLTFVNIPIRGKDVPTDDQVKQWLEVMGNSENLPVLVHCAQGVVRTGVMVALYEIVFEGKDGHEAWDELPTFGHDFEKQSMLKLRDFIYGFRPETENQSTGVRAVGP